MSFRERLASVVSRLAAMTRGFRDDPSRQGVAAALALFAILGTLNALMVPIYRPADEPRHVAYSLMLMRGEQPTITTPLPLAELDTKALKSGNVVAAANHPPLYYLLIGVPLRLFKAHIRQGVFIARFVTLALGVLSLWRTAKLLRLIAPRWPRLPALGTAVIALLPVYVNTCAITYNDALGILTSVLAIETSLRVLLDGPTRWRLVAAGAAIALALASRFMGLFAIGPALLAVFIGCLRPHEGKPLVRRALTAVLASTANVVATVALSGWFYLHNYKVYGDVSGANAALKAFGRRPQGTFFDLATDVSLWLSMVENLWVRLAGGVSASAVICEPAMTVLAVGALVSTAFVVRDLFGPRSPHKGRALVAFGFALFACACVTLPLFYFHSKGGNLNDRYMFGVLWVPALVAAYGAARMRSPLAAQTLLVVMALSFWVTYDAYAREIIGSAPRDGAVLTALQAGRKASPDHTFIALVCSASLAFAWLVQAISKTPFAAAGAEPERAKLTRATVVRWGLRLLGPVILAVTIYKLPKPSALFALLAATKAWPIALALALNFVPLYLKAVRWRVLLKTRGIEYSTRNSFLSLGASLYLGMLTPGRVGDVVRVQYVKHDAKAPYSEGLASIVVDRLADLYVLVAFVSVAMVHYGSALDTKVRVLSWAMVGGTLVGPLVLFIPGLAERVLHVVYRRLSKEPGESGWPRFLDAVRTSSRRAVAPVLGLTIASFLVGYLQGYLVAKGMGLSLSFFDCTCLIAVQSLMGLLPISVSGIGLREAFFAAVFPSLGYSAEQGTGYGLLVFFVVYAALVGVGAIAWQIRPPPTNATAATAATGEAAAEAKPDETPTEVPP